MSLHVSTTNQSRKIDFLKFVHFIYEQLKLTFLLHKSHVSEFSIRLKLTKHIEKKIFNVNCEIELLELI